MQRILFLDLLLTLTIPQIYDNFCVTMNLKIKFKHWMGLSKETVFIIELYLIGQAQLCRI